MPKKSGIGLTLLVLLLVSSQTLLNLCTLSVYAAEPPSKLKIHVAPPSVPADKGDYEIVLIQLQDSKNEPARAPEDTNISLSSSQTNIGTVDHLITIPKGSTKATAKFHTTYTPGTTEITAASTGYMTVEASVTTVGPIPSTLAVYGFPPVLPADGGAYEALVVQLQDASGSPARAPLESVQVALSSSNNTIAAVVPSVTIEAGNTHAIATINTTQEVIGSADITAMASGYSSKQTTIATQKTIMQANNLKIYVGPPSVLAEGKSHNQILVQLQNASGHIAQANSDTTVTLSSVKTDVGTVETTITIPANRTYATANFTSTYRSGTTTITAAATNYTTNQASLTTVGPIPTKLAAYCLPSLLPADNQQYKAIQVQLQDSQGKPAKDPEGDIIVNLFSSDPECGTVQTTLTIPFGETYATGNFTSTTAANRTTTITAQTSGYEPGQTVMTTKSIDEFSLAVTVTANPETVNSAQQTTLRAHVTFKDTPVLKAKLTFNSNLNGSKFSDVTEEGNGYYTAVFTAPNARNNTICTITANATKTGYISEITQLKMTINPSDTPTSTLQVQIVDENGNPISNTDVTIASQLTPDQTTSATTDETGYVTFEGLIGGDYTIQVTRDGYNAINQTITCPAGRTLSQTLILSQSPLFSLVPLSLPMLIVIIVIVVVAVVAVVVGFWYIRRRRNSNGESTEEETEESTEEGNEETTEESAEKTTEENTEKTTEESTKESTEETTEEKMNLATKCPKCGKTIKNPKKIWKMAGKPDKSGKRMQLTIGLYQCCGKTFRQVLDKKKI
jgi:hypothetical protein